MNGLTKLKGLCRGEGLKRLIILAGAGGIALLFLSGFMGGQKTEKTDYSVQSYAKQVEQELEEAVSHIEGAGKTKILLTMENSVESVYLGNGTTKTKEVEPKIRGVLVLCEGGGDPVTVGRVSEAVTKALNLSSAKVCISKLSE